MNSEERTVKVQSDSKSSRLATEEHHSSQTSFDDRITRNFTDTTRKMTDGEEYYQESKSFTPSNGLRPNDIYVDKGGYDQYRIPTQSSEGNNAEIFYQSTEEFVNTKAVRLQRIFQFYASYGETISSVTLRYVKFKKLLKECGLLKVIFPSTNI